ncbi:hypothetical protein LCGC14_2258130, partial [marine sediment metagenome]
RHTFQILTKRVDRMGDVCKAKPWFAKGVRSVNGKKEFCCSYGILPNVWLGTSVEDQPTADERIPELLKCPAAVRFVSCEPLLGPIDLTPWFLLQHAAGVKCVRGEEELFGQEARPYPTLHWVIAGGETGPGARPMNPDWPRSLRDHCQAAGVPFFFKAWGEWAPWGKPLDRVGHVEFERDHKRLAAVSNGGSVVTPCSRLQWDVGHLYPGVKQHLMMRVGKKQNGRELDGRTWDEMPEVVT